MNHLRNFQTAEERGYSSWGCMYLHPVHPLPSAYTYATVMIGPSRTTIYNAEQLRTARRASAPTVSLVAVLADRTATQYI